MTTRLAVTLAFGILVTFLMLASNDTAAQTYPSRPVRLVVPIVPGGSTDSLARLVAQKLTEKWGQPVTVENKPGGSTIIAAQDVIRAKPDGYSLLLPINSTMTINPALYAKLPYDVYNDFTHITQLANVPQGIMVGTATGITSIADLIARAKAKPESINYGTSDQATRLAMEMFAKMAGVKFTHVSYKGGADVVRALLGGEIQAAFTAVAAALPYIKTGQFRVLATGGKRRVAAIPDVPTLHEEGITNYEASVWVGLSGPGGIPRDIVNKINTDVAAVLQMPEVRDRIVALGMEPVGNSPDAYVEIIRTETARFQPLIKELGLSGTE